MATQTRRATGNSGGANSWSASAGNKYDCVSDDSDSTYIYKLTSDGGQRFTYTAFSINAVADSIDLVIRARALRTAAGAVSIRGNIFVNGVTYVSATQALGVSWAEYSFTWTVNPNTSAEWLEADIEGTGANPLTECGNNSFGLAVGEEVQSAELYFDAVYTEAGGGGLSIPVAMHHYNQMRA